MFSRNFRTIFFLSALALISSESIASISANDDFYTDFGKQEDFAKRDSNNMALAGLYGSLNVRPKKEKYPALSQWCIGFGLGSIYNMPISDRFYSSFGITTLIGMNFGSTEVTGMLSEFPLTTKTGNMNKYYTMRTWNKGWFELNMFPDIGILYRVNDDLSMRLSFGAGLSLAQYGVSYTESSPPQTNTGTGAAATNGQTGTGAAATNGQQPAQPEPDQATSQDQKFDTSSWAPGLIISVNQTFIIKNNMFFGISLYMNIVKPNYGSIKLADGHTYNHENQTMFIKGIKIGIGVAF